MLEKDIQRKIMKYLNSLEGGSFDVTTTGAYGKRGTADIVGVLYGRFIGIEVKTMKGKLSPLQESWLRKKERCGGICFVARSVQDARDGLVEVLGQG